MTDADFVLLLQSSNRSLQSFVRALVPSPADREDILQETCLALWLKRREYDVKREFTKWACGVAYMEVKRHYQRKSRSRLCFSDEAIQLLKEDAMERTEGVDERRQALQQCLRKLGKKDRAVIQGHYLDGNSVAEIAELEKVTPSAVYKTLQRTRERLRDCVAKSLSLALRRMGHDS